MDACICSASIKECMGVANCKFSVMVTLRGRRFGWGRRGQGLQSDYGSSCTDNVLVVKLGNGCSGS